MQSKILIIEDDTIIRENTAELLELSAYLVDTAENGKLGLEKVKSFEPDLIICDIMMPEIDGLGVLHILSKNPKTASIPLIFLTAKTEKEDFRKGMNMGADDYLSKPFEETDLLNAIESRLKRINQFKNDFSSNNDDLNQFLKEAESLDVIARLTEERQVRKYKAKEYLFREGDLANFLFFIQKGKIKTYKLNEDEKEYILEVYEDGDYLGYKALLENRNYNEYASTMVDSEIFKIPKDDFLKLIYSNTEMSSRFIRMMSKNLTEKEDQLLQLAYDSVKKRIAQLLIDLNKKSKGERIQISRGDLANMVATSKESLVRTLTNLKEEEIIDSDGHYISIIDLKKLEQLLDWS